MLAKSATQLLEITQSWSAALRVRRLLVMLGLTAMTVGALWLVDAREVEAERVAAVLQSHIASTPAPEGVAPAVIAAAPAPAPAPAPAEAEPPHEERHHALSEFLARRYNVSREMTRDLVTLAHTAGQQSGLDPLLILAVMAVESRFNPLAESVAGAKGLMQIIPRYHLAKFREIGGEKWSVFDPETNILVGTKILKEYLRRTGSLNAALQMYVGSPDDDSDTYTGKVMTEKQRLQQFLRKTGSRPDPRSRESAPTGTAS